MGNSGGDRMSNRILLVSEETGRSLAHAKLISERYRTSLVDPDELDGADADAASLVIFDVDLASPDTARKIRTNGAGRFDRHPKIFLLRDHARSAELQANALGSGLNLKPGCDDTALYSAIERQLAEATGRAWRAMPESQCIALNAVDELNSNIYKSIRLAMKLPREEVAQCSRQVIASLEENGVSSWLEAVRLHYSHTYRHSMNVTGMSVAYGLHLGMRHDDIHRLAVGALMHDIGKLKIPLAILDGQIQLEGEALELYREHPVFSSKMLMKDGQFDDEVVEIALNHHEYLDGSGFPRHLKLNQISDIVRVIVIMVAFSELIDPPFGAAAISPKEAYSRLHAMDGKLDQHLLAAFEPVAMSA